MSRLHIGVLGSGSGSNMQSILDAIAAGRLDATLACVISDVPDARILERARNHNVPGFYLDPAPFKTKLDGVAEQRAIETLRRHHVDTVALAGFMRMVKPGLLRAFPGRVLNIHPALLPAFPGLHSWEQALNHGAKGKSKPRFDAAVLPTGFSRHAHAATENLRPPKEFEAARGLDPRAGMWQCCAHP